MTRLQIQELIVSVIVNKTEPNTITPVMLGNILTLINDEVFGGRAGLFVYTKVDIDDYIILPADYVLSVNNGAVQWNIAIPDAAAAGVGKVYLIKRFDNTSTGQIVITPSVGLIQNNAGVFSASVSIINIWGFLDDKMAFMSNGTNWEYIK